MIETIQIGTTEVHPARTLAELADDINAAYNRAGRSSRAALQHYVEAGRALIAAKDQVEHGEWLPWLEERVVVKPRQAQKYMKLAEHWPELKAKAHSDAHLTIDEALNLLGDQRVNVLTGNTEWYTPGEFVEAARRSMGSIDCDPATCDLAQETVKADVYFTAETDGLAHDWDGNVFLNPPFKQPIVTHFVGKLLDELAAGHTEQAVLLTDNRTDTDWWQQAASHATAVCFTDGRISFINLEGKSGSPTTGQTFCYFGHHAPDFIETFSEYGLCIGKTPHPKE